MKSKIGSLVAAVVVVVVGVVIGVSDTSKEKIRFFTSSLTLGQKNCSPGKTYLFQHILL